MTTTDTGQITGLLQRLGSADPEAHQRVLGELMPLVYVELKQLARAQRERWRGPHAPGTTSLVHEIYTRLLAQDEAVFESRHQFFALAAKAMRSVLIDNARWHQRKKRGGDDEPITLHEELLVSAERSEELLALDQALDQLEQNHPGLAAVVECRCFAGLTTEETATALQLSTATIKRRWRLARAWLYRELSLDTQPPEVAHSQP